MRLLELFKKRKAHRAAKEKHHRSDLDRDRALSNLHAQVRDLRAQVRTVHMALGKHDREIIYCRRHVRRHDRVLARLEHIAGEHPAADRAQKDTPIAHSPAPSAPLREDCDPVVSAGKFDIDRFTEQEKRLLTVFFQNKGCRMSYADVAKVMNKSTHTVKNQLNHIRHKADLFEQSVGNQSRNLFKLKDDLRVEKYLNLGQSLGRPVPTSDGDHSSMGKVSVAPEKTLPQ